MGQPRAKRKLARMLWLVGVALYGIGFGVKFVKHSPLHSADAIGPIALAIVGWSVLRKPKA